jgi:hypothetical protein
VLKHNVTRQFFFFFKRSVTHSFFVNLKILKNKKCIYIYVCVKPTCNSTYKFAHLSCEDGQEIEFIGSHCTLYSNEKETHENLQSSPTTIHINIFSNFLSKLLTNVKELL